MPIQAGLKIERVRDDRTADQRKRRAQIAVNGTDDDYHARVTVSLRDTDEQWVFGVRREVGEPVAEPLGDEEPPEFVQELVRGLGVREVAV